MVFVVLAFMVGHVLRPANDLAFVGDIRNFHGLYGHFLYEFGLDVLFSSLFGFGFGDLLFFAHGFSVLSYRCTKGMPPERFPPGSCFFYSMREKARQYKHV